MSHRRGKAAVAQLGRQGALRGGTRARQVKIRVLLPSLDAAPDTLVDDKWRTNQSLTSRQFARSRIPSIFSTAYAAFSIPSRALHFLYMNLTLHVLQPAGDMCLGKLNYIQLVRQLVKIGMP
jgi:hypothetical protein